MSKNPHVIEHYETQYLNLCKRIRDYGEWIINHRTGKRIKTVIGETFVLDVGNDPYPVITTRPAPTVMPRAEILGYLKGLSNAQDFEALGAKTWYKNANETKAWLQNPNRKGEHDCGRIYGVQGRSWRKPNGEAVDQLAKLINNLKNGIDDRGEILSFYNAGEFDLGCLRPCMHTHQFNLLGNKLYLESYQRSADVPLGSVANVQQVSFLLQLIAHIVGAEPAISRLHMSNCHIYEDQYDIMVNEQLKRKPLKHITPELVFKKTISSIEDIDTWVHTRDFEVKGYKTDHEPIQYPFSE